MQDKPFTSRAIAYLKATVADAAHGGRPAVELSHAQSFVTHPIVPPLVVTYAVDTGNAYELAQNRHLAKDGVDDRTRHVR
jgi:hypothetical protein